LAVQPHPSAAEVITNDLQALIEDEQMLQSVLGACLTLQRRGLLFTTQEVGALSQGRVQRELALVRAAKRHMQHQARNEGLDICDLCGSVAGATPRPTLAGEALGTDTTCIACRRTK
jgi:hypothetical protein